MYFGEGNQKSTKSSAGFLVKKSLSEKDIVKMPSVSNRVVYLIIKLTERYSLKWFKCTHRPIRVIRTM